MDPRNLKMGTAKRTKLRLALVQSAGEIRPI